MKKLKVKMDLKKKYLLWMVGGLMVAGVALTWFLQYRYFINDAERAWAFVWERPLVFWYTALLMSLGLVFLTGLTRRPVVSAGLMWGFIIVLTYIHINKFHARGFPLLPEDFALASESASLAKFIDLGALVRMIVAVLLVGALTYLANRWVRQKFESNKKQEGVCWWNRWAVPSRVTMLLLSGLLLVGMTDFVRNHGGQRYEDIGWLNSQLVAWNQVRNYDYNGFVLGFLYNFGKFELVAPEKYDEGRTTEIRTTYEKLAKKNNAGRVALADEDVNIIVILNESFFDPAVQFNGVSFEDYYPHIGGEILPNLRAVQAKYPSGYMYSTDYGGGTANIEFEMLTGLTNYWTNTVPYTDLVPRAGEIPSVASYLKGQGYATTAIHPFNGAMYKRNIALNNFGFDRFITEIEMDYREVEGKSEYINDRSAYRQTLDVLNESDENQLITLITMQNHLPYNPDIYTGVNFGVAGSGDSEDREREIGIYYQMLHNSDAYLGEFLDELDRSNKKVAVLFFGDHSAGIFDLTNGHKDKAVRDLSRLVPYFMYTNFGEHARQQLPTTTPNCLGSTMFDVLGARKPANFYLTGAVCMEVPILANAWFEDVGVSMSRVLNDYEMMTYDLLGGKKYWTQ